MAKTTTKAKSTKTTADKTVVDDGKYKGKVYRSVEQFKRVYQETGVIGFDLAISDGQGLPVGGCILMYSAPGSGKSTLCVDIARRLLQKNYDAGIPYKCLFIDIEGGSDGLALNTDLAKFATPEYGCRLNYFPVGGMTWNEVEEIFRDIENDEGIMKDVKLVIIDSINSIQSEAQADRKKAINSGDFGTSAKDRYNLYNKYVLSLKRKGVTFLFISQQRQKQGASQFEDQKKAATADGDDHVVDCILKLTRSGGGNNKETKKVEVISMATGEKSKASKSFFCNISAPVKNRFVAGLPPVPCLVDTGIGIRNSYTMLKMLETAKFLKIGGSAKKRELTICDELISFVNAEEPFVQGSNTKVTSAWIAKNLNAIKDFMKMKDKYHAAVEQQADDEDDEE